MSSDPLRGGKILVVDDDDQYLKLTGRILRSAGYDVVMRSEVIGTSFAVASERPRLILIDLNMPLINGDRLASLIQRSVPDPPLIVLYSGANEEVLAKRAAECGADSFIPKGLAPDVFLKRVARVLNRTGGPPSSVSAARG